jgi:hypothetical protein
MFEKLSRSWTLVKSSAAVVRDEPVLMLFPLFSFIAAAAVIVTFALPLLGVVATDEVALDDGRRVELMTYVWTFLLYLTLFFVGIFFNSALVAMALLRLEGGDPGLGDGLALAVRRAPAILGYAAIAATVGLVLRAIEERVGLVGRLVTSLLGAAWSVATFLVVPVLVTRDVSPLAAVKESGRLLQRTWGENLAGNIGMSAVFAVGYGVLVAIALGGVLALAGLDRPNWIAALVVVCVVTAIALALFQGALQGVYAAALYRYATGASAMSEFPPDILGAAFVTKR